MDYYSANPHGTHTDILSLFPANQALPFLLHYACLAEQQQIHMYVNLTKTKMHRSNLVRVSGIIFWRYAQSRKVWNPNNSKLFWSKKTKGSEQESQNRIHPHMPVWGRRALVLLILYLYSCLCIYNEMENKKSHTSSEKLKRSIGIMVERCKVTPF